MIFYMPGISYINHYFRAPSPLKPLKSNSRYQNLPGEPLTAHSEPKSTKNPPKIDLCWPLFPLWSYLRSFKSLFWVARSIENEKLILSVLSTYLYLNLNALSWKNKDSCFVFFVLFCLFFYKSFYKYIYEYIFEYIYK